MSLKQCLLFILLIAGIATQMLAKMPSRNLPDPYVNDIHSQISTDTIPWVDRKGDYITDKKYNPFDITPSEIKQKVEFDPKTGQYVIMEKIGDEYYRTPSYMTFDEYLDYIGGDQERRYFNTLGGIKSEKKSKSGKIDPMDKVDLKNSLIDRLFGGTEVNIQPQGRVDLNVGWLHTRREDPRIPLNNQIINQPDFQPQIKMGVNGKIGQKLNLDFNYDTQSTFDFDRQIKLAFDSDSFSEDDIIKKIEAGNVSLPLRGNLIQGAQSLFGLKTELQFGRLRVTGLVSQQRSRNNSIKIENGVSEQRFIINPIRYDENRHFLLTHYNRRVYEKALSNLPYIGTPHQIAQIEVWISDDRPEFQENTNMVAAIADLGESDKAFSTNINAATIYNSNADKDDSGLPLPYNEANDIYEKVKGARNIEDIDKVTNILESPNFALQRTRDFEVFRGRRLNTSEFTFNPKLGTISLNLKLRPNQVLGVAYNYYYTSNPNEVYQIGELSAASINPANQADTTRVEPPKVHFVKLLKSTNQIVSSPMWDLMMKNVYNLNTSQLNPTDFEFDVYFEDDRADGSLKRYLNDPLLIRVPILELLNLDKLNRFGDPQPDGFFDYIPGVTVIERTGTVVFPVLEPFGSHLTSEKIGAIMLSKPGFTPADTVGLGNVLKDFRYDELYDQISAVTEHTGLIRNKFRMVGKVKAAAANGEISLGFFVPPGSVRVSAGGKQLIEGQDYEIDYSLGRLRIINAAYLQQGTPLDVRFEDNSLFNLQQKNMMGLRFEYQFSKKSSLGATYLRLAERPITQKVNIGDDPIKNQIFGFDYNYSDEVPFVTKLVDKLPFYSTAEKSKINFTAEAAGLKPGHAKGIDFEYKDDKGNTIVENQGIANLDDFEGAITNFNLGGFNANLWTLASTPIGLSADAEKFREAKLVNDQATNANRALINWNTLDLGTNRTSKDANPYSRVFNQNQLFQNRQVQPGQQQQLFTFDVSYYPTERGPYNFEERNGIRGYSRGFDIIDNKLVLRDPKTRWAGIQRYFQNSDFETANYESIEFWMMNPFMERPDGEKHKQNEEGRIVFNLGSVSEDVIKDNLLHFENAMPTTTRRTPVTNTIYGKATVSIPQVNGFDIQEGPTQDVGLDGLSDNEEAIKYQKWLVDNALISVPGIATDPSNDNFVFFNDSPDTTLLGRMKQFNGPEGNTPFRNTQGGNNNQFVRGNNNPDTEDINNNKTLDQTEAFYEYILDIRNIGGAIDEDAVRKYLRETKNVSIQNEKGEKQDVKWYRFQIPINSGTKVGPIDGFRGIQYMRMYMTDFESAKTFRLADFQLQRSIWRKQLPICEVIEDPGKIDFSIDDVGIEENSDKLPFHYITPEGAIRTRAFGQIANLLQDERSMALKFRNLPQSCEAGMTKLANINLALYKRLQMFVHAENLINIGTDTIADNDLAVIVRLGKDFPVDADSSIIVTKEFRRENNNYYEYELPLKVSRVTNNAFQHTEENIWPDENFIDLNLDTLLNLRRGRITSGRSSRERIEEFVINDQRGDVVRMVGNPSLGAVKMIQISVKNRTTNKILAGEVWVNELRVNGYNEDFAWAAQSRLQLQMADLGEINLQGSYSSNGFGALDKRLHERNREEKLTYDAAVNVDAGKILPKAAKLTIPVYAQYQKTIITPEFDPFDQDIRVKEKLDLITESRKRDSIKALAREELTIKTFNVTNAKINAGGTGKPWSPSNVGISYAFTERTVANALISEDKEQTRTLGLDYVYARKSSYIEPFKFIKSKAFQIISDFNFSLLPSNFSFNSRMSDQLNRRTFRQPIVPIYAFDDNRFNWERNYVLDWDFTKSLRFGYRARTNSIVDQLRYVGVANTLEDRYLVDEKGSQTDENKRNYRDIVSEIDDPNYYRNKNLRSLGRAKAYSHNVSLNYKLPFKSIPILNWVTAGADYKADYAWDGGSLIKIDEAGTLLGNTIRNGQNASMNVTLDFSRLYNKSGYLKSIETGKAQKKNDKSQTPSRQRTVSSRGGKDTSKLDAMDAEKTPDQSGSNDEVDSDKSKKSSKKDKSDKKDEPRNPSLAERIIIRPLLSVRSIKFNYKEDRTTVIPGFMPQSRLLGQSEGFTAPGWDFIAGIQPQIQGSDNWLQRNQEWFNPSTNFNEQLTQTKRHALDIKALVEPFKDFSVDVSFKKNYQETHNEVFRKTEKTGDSFQQLALFDVGSYDASYYTLNTLFRGSKGLYDQFKLNREIVSRRLPNVESPGVYGQDPRFPGGYGPTHTAVTVPAFIATYTNRSAWNVELDQVAVFSKNTFIPKPNWQLNYNGLGKLSMFKKHFSNITIKHGYASTVRVSSFQTSPLFDNQDPFGNLSPNDNYYTRLEVPSVQIQEQFVPVLGISLKTVKDLKLDMDFKMTRALSLDGTQLRENKNTEITIGGGYVIKNFRTIKKEKKKKNSKKGGKDSDNPDADPKKGGGLLSKLVKDKGTSAEGKDLKINLAYSLRDDISEVYDLQTGIDGQANRGQKTVTFSPTVEYDVNKNLALRFYFDYSRSVPKTTLSFPTTTIRSGVTLRFSIN
jgi:cell surface protein SprA